MNLSDNQINGIDLLERTLVDSFLNKERKELNDRVFGTIL